MNESIPMPQRGSMAGQDLRDVDLTDRDLAGADLRGANMEGVDLQDTQMGHARLEGATLFEADLFSTPDTPPPHPALHTARGLYGKCPQELEYPVAVACAMGSGPARPLPLVSHVMSITKTEDHKVPV